MMPKFLRRRTEKMPSLSRKVFMSLGSIAAILLLSSVISILEYRRMSTYVSDLIASNIKSITLSQKLSDLTDEYNHKMLSVVVQNDISIMPEFDLQYLNAQADSLKHSFTSKTALPMVDSVAVSFNDFMVTSMKFDEVFLADNVDTGEWFFGTLQPCYNRFRQDIDVLNEMIHEELASNSADFDEGFYRSIIPGVVSVGAGLLLVVLLLYFTISGYVRPIYRISDGIDNYRKTGRKHGYTFDGDDQLANINEGVSEIIEENIELKKRVKALKEERVR
jgi:predicted PurR-regulated permease PerM